MLTDEQLKSFLNKIGVNWVAAGRYRTVEGKPMHQDYYVLVGLEPYRIIEPLCWHFGKSRYEVFAKPPSWGHAEIEFTFRPEIEAVILEGL